MSKVILKETPYEVNAEHPIKLLPENANTSIIRNSDVYKRFSEAVNSLNQQRVFSEANKLFKDSNESQQNLLGISFYDIVDDTPIILRKSLLEINAGIEHDDLVSLIGDIVEKPLVTDLAEEANTVKGLDAVYAFRSEQSNIYSNKLSILNKYTELFDQSYSTVNIRATGSEEVPLETESDGSYLFNCESPFYTVLTDDPDPKMEILCRSFILPMERFDQSANIFIFKYPEHLIGESKEIINSIDKCVLRLSEQNKTAKIYKGSKYFGFVDDTNKGTTGDYFTNIDDIVLGNLSLLNYTTNHQFLQRNSN